MIAEDRLNESEGWAIRWRRGFTMVELLITVAMIAAFDGHCVADGA